MTINSPRTAFAWNYSSFAKSAKHEHAKSAKTLRREGGESERARRREDAKRNDSEA